jgi:hypothetical protein
MCLNRWPELLAQGVPDLEARVAFLGALGPVGQLPQAVRGRLWDAQLGWLPVRMGEGGFPGWGCLGGAWHWELSALPVPSRHAPASRLGGWAAGRPALQVAADWGQRVQPCIAYLVDELGVSDAQSFLAACPMALAVPVYPLSDAASSLDGTAKLLGSWLAGGGQLPGAAAADSDASKAAVRQLLTSCPAILGRGQLELLAGLNFLADVAGGDAQQLLDWPAYLAADLQTVIGALRGAAAGQLQPAPGVARRRLLLAAQLCTSPCTPPN